VLGYGIGVGIGPAGDGTGNLQTSGIAMLMAPPWVLANISGYPM